MKLQLLTLTLASSLLATSIGQAAPGEVRGGEGRGRGDGRPGVVGDIGRPGEGRGHGRFHGGGRPGEDRPGRRGDWRRWAHPDVMIDLKPRTFAQQVARLTVTSDKMLVQVEALRKAVRGDRVLGNLEGSVVDISARLMAFKAVLSNAGPGRTLDAAYYVYEIVDQAFVQVYEKYLQLMLRDQNGDEVSFFNDLGMLAAVGESNALMKDLLDTCEEPVVPAASKLLASAFCFGGSRCPANPAGYLVTVADKTPRYRYIKFVYNGNVGDKSKGWFSVQVNGRQAPGPQYISAEEDYDQNYVIDMGSPVDIKSVGFTVHPGKNDEVQIKSLTLTNQ